LLKRLVSASVGKSARNWRATASSQSWPVVHSMAWKALKSVAALQFVRIRIRIRIRVRVRVRVRIRVRVRTTKKWVMLHLQILATLRSLAALVRTLVGTARFRLLYLVLGKPGQVRFGSRVGFRCLDKWE
jgi:hypothetical protein